jgi:hypothetical protein
MAGKTTKNAAAKMAKKKTAKKSAKVAKKAAAKHEDVRYLDIREDRFDEAQMATWIRQAAALPGWDP